MWHELLVALSLLLVVEGLMPFLSPDTTKKYLLTIAQLDQRLLRLGGLVCMLSGVVLLYSLRSNA